MKRILALLLTTIMTVMCFPTINVFAASEGRCLLYISTSGNDSNDGSYDYPFATFQAARDKIRELKATGLYPKGFTVYVRGGTYNVSEGLLLDERDSGTAEAPITYRAYEDEEVIVTGGITVKGTDFEKVTDTEILSRVVEKSARDHIYKLDLTKFGVSDLGGVIYKGSYGHAPDFVEAGLIPDKPKAPAMEFFFNGSQMIEARYPNSGYMYTSGVITAGYNHNALRTPDERPVDECMVFTVDDDRVKYWEQAAKDGALMYGFWFYDWADQAVPIAKLDVKSKTITSGVPSMYGVTTERPFYVYNLIEEIDVPGEYYLDKDNLTVYMYPSASMDKAEITMTIMEDHVFEMRNVDHIKFRGINVLGSRNSAYFIGDGSTYCEVSDAEISFSANYGVHIDHYTYNNGVRDCYVHDVESGIAVGGGNFETLKPGNCYAENCEVERWSRITATYKSGIGLGGVGNRISFCEMHDAPHVAVQFSGNYNVLEFNEIYDVVHSSDDAGAVYGGLNWTGRGNEFRYNYFII